MGLIRQVQMFTRSYMSIHEVLSRKPYGWAAAKTIGRGESRDNLILVDGSESENEPLIRSEAPADYKTIWRSFVLEDGFQTVPMQINVSKRELKIYETDRRKNNWGLRDFFKKM